MTHCLSSSRSPSATPGWLSVSTKTTWGRSHLLCFLTRWVCCVLWCLCKSMHNANMEAAPHLEHFPQQCFSIRAFQRMMDLLSMTFTSLLLKWEEGKTVWGVKPIIWLWHYHVGGTFTSNTRWMMQCPSVPPGCSRSAHRRCFHTGVKCRLFSELSLCSNHE